MEKHSKRFPSFFSFLFFFKQYYPNFDYHYKGLNLFFREVIQVNFFNWNQWIKIGLMSKDPANHWHIQFDFEKSAWAWI